MKKTYLLILLIIFISCQKEKAKTEINIVDNYAEKIFYKLDILYDDVTNIYQLDENGRCSVVMNNNTYLNNEYFGSFKEVYKAVQKANQETESGKLNEVIQRTTIGIKNKKNIYEEIWTYDNKVNLNKNDPKCNGCYGLYENKIELEDGITKYQDKRVYCLKIIFKEIDDGEGSITRTFFYYRNDGVWRLIKRAKLNTKEKTYVEEEFDKDYTDLDCDYGNNKNRIKISISCLVD